MVERAVMLSVLLQPVRHVKMWARVRKFLR